MSSHKELSPSQGLPEEGDAVPCGGQSTQDGTPPSVAPTNSMPRKAGAKGTSTGLLHQLELISSAADEIVQNEAIDELDWPMVLAAKTYHLDLTLRESDIKRALRAAKQRATGRKDIRTSGEQIDRRENEWLWQGVIMRQATNLVFAHPKVGKTRLMLAMLAEFSKGRGEFAGLPLYPGDEKLLLLGPDQSIRSWGNYLDQVGLLTEDNCIPEWIAGMVSAEECFTLDEYWLSKIDAVLQESGPSIVLLDSYAAAISGLGLDENKPEVTAPLSKLHALVMAHNSTLIVIHHSNKSSGDGDISKMARGSSSITAAADNLIGMQRWKEDEGTGVKKYELLVTGRAETDGTPLIGYDKHSEEWVSCGSASSARSEKAKDEAYDNLTIYQMSVLEHLCLALKGGNQSLKVAELVEKTIDSPTKGSRVKVSKTLKRLQSLGFVELDTSHRRYHPKQENYWKPTAWGLAKHSSEPSYPDS